MQTANRGGAMISTQRIVDFNLTNLNANNMF